MTDTWTSSFGGTSLEGPADAWQHPDTYWTPEFDTTVRAARESGQPVACPVCHTAVASTDMESVYGMREDLNQPLVSFAGHVGQLFTLHPCGHTLSK